MEEGCVHPAWPALHCTRSSALVIWCLHQCILQILILSQRPRVVQTQSVAHPIQARRCAHRVSHVLADYGVIIDRGS